MLESIELQAYWVEAPSARLEACCGEEPRETSARIITVPIMAKTTAEKANPKGKPFGRDLREWRKKRGLSQTQVGNMMGLTQPTISKIERGGTEDPETATIVAGSALMGEDPAKYLPDAPKKPRSSASSAVTPTKSPFVSRQEFEALEQNFAAFVEILAVVVGATVEGDRSLPAHTKAAILQMLAELQAPDHSRKRKLK